MNKPNQNTPYTSVKRFMADFFPLRAGVEELKYRRSPIKLVDLGKDSTSQLVDRVGDEEAFVKNRKPVVVVDTA